MDYKIYLHLDNNVYIKDIRYDLDTIKQNNKLTIKNLYLDEFSNIEDYFFIKDSKIISLDKDIIIEDATTTNAKNTTNPTNPTNPSNPIIIHIECHRPIRGGGDGFLDLIFKLFDLIFGVIFKPIEAVGNVFLFVLQFIIWLFKLIIWVIQFVIWLFTDLLNPINFVNDFYNSLVMIIVSLCRIPFDVIMALFTFVINMIGQWMSGFWGWDMSGLNKNDKNSIYFKSFNRKNGQKSYLTNSNTVPFSIILGTILCPPMGVFMDLGITGWLNIVICALLTLLFYLPGLCYALLILYS